MRWLNWNGDSSTQFYDITVPGVVTTLLSTRIQDFRQALIASLDTTARIRHELKDKMISILKEDGDYLYNEPAY